MVGFGESWLASVGSNPTFVALRSSRIYLALKFLIDMTWAILATGSSPNSAGAVTITW
jgi:hypothetical protein